MMRNKSNSSAGFAASPAMQAAGLVISSMRQFAATSPIREIHKHDASDNSTHKLKSES
jgi:hypothetical protein